ncbi:MAG: CRISPR-associated endonuclease Cas2 [Desulfobacteraceae bacterium 4572_35.1]|nr:MAG: CRISPR-associated endonuclease Cas2 [Desulfobacteraceae bacterium 4572_35.1]
MLALVSYDIVENKTRSRFHRYLKEFGLNTQKSIFECEIDQFALQRICEYAQQNLDAEQDSLIVFSLCRRCQGQVAVSGLGIKVVSTQFMVI